MTLSPGTSLGPYEVTAQLGVGGMGEVYRATDTRLKRQVAIKVLPASVAQDGERLARFQREAEVLAALNHLNIAQIYGLEPVEGATALVMELVEGPTLADRIAQGAIPVDEALPIAKQIAEALEAAHEQGIIHRDLKPANIKVRADGTVKVLDFGLAKAMEPASALRVSSGQALSMSPTITTPAMTQAGMILGTAAYMSPEQARGKVVDKRADIWAFGAVLFEMLAGTRAFEGEDVADTLGNVMKVEPNWQRLPASIAARVVQVLRACLQKNPKQRMDSAQDVRLALEGAFETAVPQTTAGPSSASRGRSAWMAAFAVSALGIVVLAVPTLRHLRETPLPETRTEISTPATNTPGMFALSPDGRQIVFVASGDGGSRLWVRPLGATTAQPLAGTEGATWPFWSPDGRSLGFFAGGALKRLDLGGGAPQTLAPAINGIGGTWNAEGIIVFAPSATSPLQRVAATGGAVTAATAVGPQQSGHVLPFFLPDGRRVLFGAFGGADAQGIYLGALDGGTPTRLAPDLSQAVYVPEGSGDGWLLWGRAGTLVAQRLDLDRQVLAGDPVTLADGATAVSNNLAGGWSVAASGTVAYRTGVGSRRQLMWVDLSGTAQGTVGDPDETVRNPRLSPDGRRVTVERTVQGNTDLWVLDGTRTSRLTFDPARDNFPLVSRDGTRIVFRSNRTGIGDLYEIPMSGAGGETRLVGSDQSLSPWSWSPDGRFLLYQTIAPQSTTDLLVLAMVGEHTPSVFLKTPFREAYPAFSPDGHWVAYQSNESGRPEIYVRPFVPPSPPAPAGRPGAAGPPTALPGGQWQISTAGGITPMWRPDGKALYYLNPAGEMMAAPITVAGGAPEPGAPAMLFPTRILGGGEDTQIGRQYDVARDGRFLINTELPGEAVPITLIQNWNPEAQK